jgi:hypothetical protein
VAGEELEGLFRIAMTSDVGDTGMLVAATRTVAAVLGADDPHMRIISAMSSRRAVASMTIYLGIPLMLDGETKHEIEETYNELG